MIDPVTAIGLSVGLFGSLAGNIFNNQANKQNIEDTNRTNMDIADKNLGFQREIFNYQKELNNNQIQMQAADAQKAGINPLAMNSGSLSSGSFSNVDAHQQAAQSEAPDFSALMSLAELSNSNKQQAEQIKSDEYINNSNNETAERNAYLQAQTQKEIAEKQINAETERQKKQIESEENIEALRLSEDARQFDATHGLDKERFEDDKSRYKRDADLAEAQFNQDADLKHMQSIDNARDLYAKLKYGSFESKSEIGGMVSDLASALGLAIEGSKDTVMDLLDRSRSFEEFYRSITGHGTARTSYHYTYD